MKIVSKDNVLKAAVEDLDAILTKWVSDFDFAVVTHGLSVQDLDEQAQIVSDTAHTRLTLSTLSEKLDPDFRDFVEDIVAVIPLVVSGKAF